MAASSQATKAQEIVCMNDSRMEKIARLHEVLYPNVIRTIRETISHSITPEDIEDIASKVWTEVFQKMECYDPAIATISTWINTIAQRRAIDYMRRAKKTSNVIGFDDLHLTQKGDHYNDIPPIEHIIDKAARNPEEILMDDHCWKFISIMVKMQDMPRLMAWVCYLEEKEENSSITYRQIAEQLSEIEGKPVTAKSVERSFARLRDRFRELYEEE